MCADTAPSRTVGTQQLPSTVAGAECPTEGGGYGISVRGSTAGLARLELENGDGREHPRRCYPPRRRLAAPTGRALIPIAACACHQHGGACGRGENQRSRGRDAASPPTLGEPGVILRSRGARTALPTERSLLQALAGAPRRAKEVNSGDGRRQPRRLVVSQSSNPHWVLVFGRVLGKPPHRRLVAEHALVFTDQQ